MAWVLKELYFGGGGVGGWGGSKRSKDLEVEVINKEDVYLTINSRITRSVGDKTAL